MNLGSLVKNIGLWVWIPPATFWRTYRIIILSLNSTSNIFRKFTETSLSICYIHVCVGKFVYWAASPPYGKTMVWTTNRMHVLHKYNGFFFVTSNMHDCDWVNSSSSMRPPHGITFSIWRSISPMNGNFIEKREDEKERFVLAVQHCFLKNKLSHQTQPLDRVTNIKSLWLSTYLSRDSEK